jgi:hypothetical protein
MRESDPKKDRVLVSIGALAGSRRVARILLSREVPALHVFGAGSTERPT